MVHSLGDKEVPDTDVRSFKEGRCKDSVLNKARLIDFRVEFKIIQAKLIKNLDDFLVFFVFLTVYKHHWVLCLLVELHKLEDFFDKRFEQAHVFFIFSLS